MASDENLRREILKLSSKHKSSINLHYTLKITHLKIDNM